MLFKLLLLLPPLVMSVDQEVKYAEFHDAVAKYGYMWEPHEVKTEDGWHLTMFRITGIDGQRREEDPNRFPLLMQHGFGESATSWVEGGVFERALPLRLFDQGYDLWLGNNRGMIYSNKNDRDGVWSSAERWSWNFADLGKYDIPAQVKGVLEVTGKEKVTLIGYS